MARKTAKYVAALALVREQAITLPRGSRENSERVYETIEAEGWWWDSGTGAWSNKPRPRRQRVAIGGEGKSPNMVSIRVEAHIERMSYATTEMRRFGDGAGWELLNQSEAYVAADGIAQVYMSFMVPTVIVITEAR